MTGGHGIFHPGFEAKPYWWEAWTPGEERPAELPGKTDVAIVGGGYAGLSAALELARAGTIATVIEANDFGQGASTRNGGHVSGGVNLAKSVAWRSGGANDGAGDRDVAAVLTDAADSLNLLETIIARENIDCVYERTGRFVGAYTRKHYDVLERRAEALNRHTDAGASTVPRERQREEIASDFYFGGMIVRRAGKLHLALYYKGLLDACRRQGVRSCAKARGRHHGAPRGTGRDLRLVAGGTRVRDGGGPDPPRGIE